MTAPSVVYKCKLNDGSMINIDAPSKLVDADERQEVQEPYVAMELFCPKEYSGTLMELCQTRRGEDFRNSGLQDWWQTPILTLTRHPSPVTPDTPPLTPHPSPLTPHPSLLNARKVAAAAPGYPSCHYRRG